MNGICNFSSITPLKLLFNKLLPDKFKYYIYQEDIYIKLIGLFIIDLI